MTCLDSPFLQLHIKSKSTNFIGEYIEACRRARLESIFTLDHRFVNFCPTLNIVTLYGHQFLKNIGGTVCLQRPNFHFPESLAPKACLSAQRLLGDQRVGPRTTGMDLLIDEMVKFEHVDIADGCFLLERLPGTPVVELCFSIRW